MRTDPAGTTDYALKSKGITRKTSIRDARDYVKRIRYPVHRSSNRSTTRPWRTILTINEDPASPLTPDDLLKVQQEVSKVLKGYGVEVRTPEREESIRDLQNKQRAEQEGFWRTFPGGTPDQGLVQRHLDRSASSSTSGPSRKPQRTLRQFTGFIIKFWKEEGKGHSGRNGSVSGL